jgi:hypothetical protein
LPVLADQHERRQEDRFQGHDEGQLRPRIGLDKQHPDHECHRMEVDEWHRSGEGSDQVGDPELEVGRSLRLVRDHHRVPLDLCSRWVRWLHPTISPQSVRRVGSGRRSSGCHRNRVVPARNLSGPEDRIDSTTEAPNRHSNHLMITWLADTQRRGQGW